MRVLDVDCLGAIANEEAVVCGPCSEDAVIAATT